MKNIKLISVCKGKNLKANVKAIGIITEKIIKNNVIVPKVTQNELK